MLSLAGRCWTVVREQWVERKEQEVEVVVEWRCLSLVETLLEIRTTVLLFLQAGRSGRMLMGGLIMSTI